MDSEPRVQAQVGQAGTRCSRPRYRRLSVWMAILQARGFVEGNNAKPATYVVERAFLEK